MSHAKKWREAWPNLADAVQSDALEKFGPFPSTYANDLVHVLHSKGVDEEALKLVADLKRELDFAYSGWSRSALTPNEMLKDISSGVGQLTPGAGEFFNIINNYRRAHNISDA